jgi:predicted RNA-binding Zn-ribbon protein involved in translation (DUF1610 family)
MLKFRCQQCGQRIAVPSRHLGKLVTCSECGAQTHPLAEQIVGSSARPAAPSKETAAVAARAGACDNCGSVIGRLQSTHDWQGHTVCGACFPRLLGDSKGAVGAPAASALVTRARAEPVVELHGRVNPEKPLALELRERVLRALTVFVVASVALYGALTLLRDIAGLVAVAAVAVVALLALYALFRGTLAARRRNGRPAVLLPVQGAATSPAPAARG